MTVFEYGAGGSTLWFARHAKHVVTVEHNPAWADAVEQALGADGLVNAEVVRVLPEVSCATPEDISDPFAYFSSDEALAGYRFRNYASFIDKYPEHAFDVVSVDGRARPSCIYHGHARVKRGGYLILDNSDRPAYHPAYRFLSGWEVYAFAGPGPYSDYQWETTVWRRPGLEGFR
jgi:hypothetical protein